MGTHVVPIFLFAHRPEPTLGYCQTRAAGNAPVNCRTAEN